MTRNAKSGMLSDLELRNKTFAENAAKQDPRPTTIQWKIKLLREELKKRVLERDEVIDGAIIALLARVNIFLLGRPGTAKTFLANLLCKAITGAKYFEYLMKRGTKLEELYGPLKLSKLANDQYIYNTKNRLPEADIVFLDETWKTGSGTGNALLKNLNEHEFENDGIMVPIPMITCFGASNELPESAELDAIYDRFLLRYEVQYIADSDNFKKMIKMRRNGNKTPIQNTITLAELKEAQQEVAAFSDEGVEDILNELKNRFTQAGHVYSDRRWQAAVDVLCTAAWLEGRTKVSYVDVSKLDAIFWDLPEQKREVRRIVLAFSNPDLQAALELLDQAVSIAEEAKKTAATLIAQGKKAYDVGGEANNKLGELKTRLEHLTASTRRDEVIEQVRLLMREVQQKCLGI